MVQIGRFPLFVSNYIRKTRFRLRKFIQDYILYELVVVRGEFKQVYSAFGGGAVGR
jgi:hypothetical protein